ncbi:hypothetical protein B0H34DRAFT_757084 [Crassisporium funariophilum]|nr:hypothetical protein B0H34DRAFT_757084 [Crassisporium funariophilum]
MSSCDNPNVDKDALMTKRQKFDGKTKVCVKCKENTGNIVVRYAVYCKTCFFPLIQTRFRKSLEPSVNAIPDGPRRKALQAKGSLVIGFSGGTSSTTVLDLVANSYFAQRGAGGDDGGATEEKLKGGTDHPRNAEKGVWKGKPAVCYVEVCGATPGEEDRTEEIHAIVKNYPAFDFIGLRLEDAFDPEWWNRVGGGDLISSAQSLGMDMTDEDLRFCQASTSSSPNYSPSNALRAYLSSLPTQTAIHSATQTLIRLLLLHTAASRRASHLVLGTSLTSLSVNLISGIAQGAGFSVAEEAKEEWTPRQEGSMVVRVVRPLRDVGMKECAIWSWWCGLHPVGGRRHLSNEGKNGIGSLTRDFIIGLESDYPATVSTIARTCAKLAPKEASDSTCALCGRPAQRDVQAWKARISIRSYQDAAFAISGNTKPPHLSEDEITKLIERPSNMPAPTGASYSLTPHLCYACHTTLTSRSSRGAALSLGQSATDVPLPMWVRSGVVGQEKLADDEGGGEGDEVMRRTKLTEAQMKEQIGEFLLPDE